MSERTIRPMQPAHWPRVTQIYEEGMKTGRATFETQCPSYDDWDAAHEKDCRLVILSGGEVAGWAALSPVSGRCVYGGVAEVSIYIGEDSRGKGLGRELLTALTEKSEQEGYWTLQSGILEENTASIRLHEACGFRLVGYRERIGRDSRGVWRNVLLMERRRQDDNEKGCDSECCQK